MGILDYMDTDPEKTGVQMQPVQMEDVPAAAPFNVEAGKTQFQVDPSTLAMLDRGKVQAMDVNEAKKIIQAGDFVFNKMPQAQAYDMQAKARAMADAERAQMKGDLPPPPPPSMMDKLSTWAKSVWDDEEQMTKLALAFNTMRLEPDQALAAGLMKRLDKFQDQKKINKTANMLINSKDPKMKTIGELMLAGFDYSDAVAAAKETSFDKQMALVGNDLEKWNKIFGSKGTTVQVGGEQSKGWQKIDEEFAQVYVDWNKGAADSAYKNIGGLKTVLNALEGGEQLTGAVIGMSPDVALKIFNPEAVDARQRVESVIQQSMKEILGAQFTEKEGERLVARSYDPALQPAQNAARLKAMVMMLEGAAAAKEQMIEHFREKGTLSGFKRTNMPTAGDFERAMEAAAPLTKERRDSLAKPQNAPQIGTIVDGYRFTGGDPSKEANWTKVGQ